MFSVQVSGILSVGSNRWSLSASIQFNIILATKSADRRLSTVKFLSEFHVPLKNQINQHVPVVFRSRQRDLDCCNCFFFFFRKASFYSFSKVVGKQDFRFCNSQQQRRTHHLNTHARLWDTT